MKKTTLHTLGSLDSTHDLIWNDLCRVLRLQGEGSPHARECAAKLRLLDKLSSEIEEQARGFKKSSLPWLTAGAFFIRNHVLPYSELHRGVTAILLNTKPATDTISLFPPTLCTGRDQTIDSLIFYFRNSFLFMNNATATPFKTIFQNQKTPPAATPKPATHKEEQKPAPAPSTKRENKLWFAYATFKGKPCIIRYNEKGPPNEKELLNKEELSYKEWSTLSRSAFLRSYMDDGDPATATENFAAPSVHAAGIVAAKLLAPAIEKIQAAKKSKTDAK